MGFFNFLKSQFIEVIEWTDVTTNTMVYRFPVQNQEIKMGAQLTVRASQAAIFINEGQIADVFGPGRFELSTQNMPLLTKLKSWKYGFDSPFKAEVYFVNTKQFTNQKWGTANPIMMRDSEFGMIRLRAYGNYSFRVTDPTQFLREIFGTNHLFDTEKIVGQLKRIIISGLSDLFGESKIPVLDFAMYYDELSEQSKQKLQPHFEKLGLSLTSLYIENISLPKEVEAILDKKTSLGIIGDLDQYTKYQISEALRDAAKNEGTGMTGAGIGLGAGVALGNTISEAFREINRPATNQQPTVQCPHCHQQIEKNHRFCSFCGKPVTTAKNKCIKCHAEIEADAKFCPKCGTPQNLERSCKNCGQKISLEMKFCPECGMETD